MIIKDKAPSALLCSSITEILCPSCGRDVTEAELTAHKCASCSADLSTPQQNMTIEAPSIIMFGTT
jgi:DNA-directed RNA polymerase subunit RPC12/RpoP